MPPSAPTAVNDKPPLGNQEARKLLQEQIYLSLGGGMVDIELDPKHYTYAIDKAYDWYRSRSINAVEESYGFLELLPEQTDYYLPNEVIEVRQIFRRGTGGGVSGGTFIDPFSIAFTNAYLLSQASGSLGGLATYDFFAQYQSVLGRLFGRDVLYTWNPTNKRLVIMRKMLAPEVAVLWLYNYRPDFQLWADPYAKPILRDYAIGTAKVMLGEARSKFATIAGPQGGTSLNGDALKQEGNALLEKCEERINKGEDAREGYTFLHG
jgi:hypothetical protein